jgi:hypothetical protein
MPYDPASLPPLRKPVFVLPYYGYGWSREDAVESTLSESPNVGPMPFGMQLEEWIYRKGTIVGASGQITESGHELDRLWMAFLIHSLPRRIIGSFKGLTTS